MTGPEEYGVTFHPRRRVRPEDLSARGSLLRRNVEESAIDVIRRPGDPRSITAPLSGTDVASSAAPGDRIEDGLPAAHGCTAAARDRDRRPVAAS